jgi:hypothetical protein
MGSHTHTHPPPQIWGYQRLYQNLNVTPFVWNEGNDDPLSVRKIVIFATLSKNIDPFSKENNILPPYVRTIFKKFTPLVGDHNITTHLKKCYGSNRRINLSFNFFHYFSGNLSVF